MKSQLSVSVEVSDDIKKEFERDPIPQALPPLPSQEEIDKHDLTHLRRADWREACPSARSKEDKFSKTASEERTLPVFPIEYMFTGTKDEETGEKDPLSVQLVGICSQTKYCMVVAAPAKRSMLKEATQEICRGLMFLGVPEVTLRRDSGPATKQLSDASKLTRKDLA